MKLFKAKTPVETLAKVIWRVVYQEWDEHNALGKANQESDRLLLQTAYRYLTKVEKEKIDVEDLREARRNRADQNQTSHREQHGNRKYHYSWLSELPALLSTVAATIIIGLLIFSILYTLFTVNWIEFFNLLISEFLSFIRDFGWSGLGFFLLPFAWLIAALLVPKFMPQELVFAGYPGQFGDFRTLDDVKNDRAIIWNMVGDTDGTSDGGSVASKNDTDFLLPSGAQPPAVPPGVTELSLKNSNRAVSAIRTSLIQLRSYHHRLTQVFSGGFAVSLFVAMTGLLFLDFDPALILGSGGFMAGTGLFTFVALQNLRSSTYALALFESFVAELADALEFAASLSPENRQEKTDIAWLNFRLGVNDLHRRDRWISRGDPKPIDIENGD